MSNLEISKKYTKKSQEDETKYRQIGIYSINLF